MPDRVLKIQNVKGLHARASAKFVEAANGFAATVTVTREGQSVDATSIMGLMMLAAAKGCDIALSATGAEAEAALDALEALVEAKFGEGE